MQEGAARRVGSLVSLFNLPQVARLFASLLGDARVSIWLKLAAGAGVVYIFSPLDIIPDFTGFGLLDDVIVTLLIMQVFIEVVPADIFEEHCRKLKIDPEKLFIDIPRTVADSLEIIAGIWKTTQAASQAVREAAHAEAPAATEPSAPVAAVDPAAAAAPTPATTAVEAFKAVVEPPAAPPAPAEVPESVKRYSAYSKEQP